MLHELLISLSGHSSPFLQSSSSESAYKQPDQAASVLSPPEIALLSSIGHLGKLHLGLQSHTSLISSTHPSTICRAVSTALVSTHLAKFQQKIIEVERSILKEDAGLVGGYGIVPLAGVVGEFDEWTRRMEWFWEIVQFMLPTEIDPSQSNPCSGAAIIDRLREESHTGYPDLEEACLDLIKVAETAWLRQLSTWVLYGRLPAFGADDFFIHDSPENTEASARGAPVFVIQSLLLPRFVTAATASAILFIGKSLNHIRSRRSQLSSSAAISDSSPALSLLPAHLQYISSLSFPISPSSLSSAIATIRLSLSQNTLQHLLPLPKIIEILSLLREFFLLGRGEFAVALISEADERIRSRWRRPGQISSDQKHDGLGSVVVKEGEVTAVLARTWAALSSFQGEEDAADENLDLARDLMYLSLSKTTTTTRNATPGRGSSPNHSALNNEITFSDFLLSTPTTLSLRIPSPLDLFLGPQDLEIYSSIHAYLLSIRRAHLRLTSLWQHTSLRREHPSPLAPPYSNTKAGELKMHQRRHRTNERSKKMRRVWAIAGAAAFLLAEMGGYFQGELVQGCWESFRTWLSRTSSNDADGNADGAHLDDGRQDIWRSSTTTTTSSASRRQTTPASSTGPPTTDDPESLSRAHALYLSHLLSSLLLTSVPFTATLRIFLLSTDYLIALVTRLDRAQQGLDLESDEGVVDALNDYAREELEAQALLDKCCMEVGRNLREVVARLREVDGESGNKGTEVGEACYVPGGVKDFGGVDRLLMKLDFGVMMEDNFGEEKG